MNLAATPARRWLFGSFLILSAADLYLTWRLFAVEGSAAGEQNPLANWVLDHHGWAGVACLKLCTVALVVIPVAAIFRARPRTASRLLGGCCAVLGTVVFYSSLLLYFPGTVAAESRDVEQAMRDQNDALDSAISQTTERILYKQQLAQDVVERRRPLAEAVEAVAATEEPDSVRIRHMRWLYKDCNDQECLAVNLMEFALTYYRADPARMKRLVQELASAYEASYGTAVPGCWWDVSGRLLAAAVNDEPPVTRPLERRGWFRKFRRVRDA